MIASYYIESYLQHNCLFKLLITWKIAPENNIRRSICKRELPIRSERKQRSCAALQNKNKNNEKLNVLNEQTYPNEDQFEHDGCFK